MAFDQNLEADRIDGFSLFSAFVRVPLLVLGGILGGDESVSKDIDADILSNAGIRRQDGSETSFSSVENDENDPSVAIRNDSLNRKMQRPRSSSLSMPKKCAVPDLQDCENDNGSGIKRKKRMSWSDESGLPLVYENEESMSHSDHRISPYSSATGSYQKPTKSVLRKTRSIRHVANELSDQDKTTASPGTQSRYIPNMNPRTAGNGLIMPTRPYGRYTSADNKMLGSSGTESPQWGWYINTTPPTPELYSSKSTISNSQLMKVDHNNSKNRHNSVNSDPKSCQNQVFQNLQNSTKANPVGGWTSIPI